MYYRFYQLLLTVIVASSTLSGNGFAQTNDDEPVTITVSPEEGIRFTSSDGFMEYRLGFRLQEQFILTQPLSEKGALQGSYKTRRARALFLGSLFHKKLDYLIQIGMGTGTVTLLNAEFRWKPDKYTQFAFGQFFPPTMRQFQTVSGHLQLADRSDVTRFFFTDFDKGIRVKRTISVSEHFQMKVSGALTDGEGRNVSTAPGGWAYMGRMEILPLGAFEKGGDYSESDLVGEQTPKLSIGGGYYFNHDAYTKLGSTVWDGLDDDIADHYIDLVFKYSGFSLVTEYIVREVDNEILTIDDVVYEANKVSAHGYYIQGGKMLTEKLEPTFRFSIIDPNDAHQILNHSYLKQTKVVAGLNYFLRGHAIKMQGQIGYVDEELPSSAHDQHLEVLSQFTISF